MAYYAYKTVRDLLMDAGGYLDECAEPLDKEKYEDADCNYDGSLWLMASDYIEELQNKIKQLEEK